MSNWPSKFLWRVGLGAVGALGVGRSTQWRNTFNGRDQNILQEMGKGDRAEQIDLDVC